MAIQKISGGIVWPNMIPLSNPTPATVSFTSNIKQYACNFRAPRTGTILAIGFNLNSNVFNSNAFTVGLQSVNSTGWPSGTYLASGSAYGLFLAFNTYTGWYYNETGLNVAPAVNQGDLLSVVWTAPSSFSLPVGLGYLKTSATVADIGEPAILNYTTSTSSWGTTNVNGFPSFTLVYSDLSYANIPYVYPFHQGALAANSFTNLQQMGVKFSLPFIASICGAVIDKETFTGSSGSAELVLYDQDGVYANALAKVNIRSSENNGALNVYFPTDIILQPNVQYRLVLRVSSGVIPALPVLYQWATNNMPSATGSPNFMLTYTATSQPVGATTDHWQDFPFESTFLSLMINGLDDDTGNSVSNISGIGSPIGFSIQ